ncbi:MAG: radical SAM/SPASM domain-containing protein [bacterium]
MSFAEFVHKTWSENILFSVLLELTYDCNLDCAICYNDIDQQGQRLTLNQYLSLLDELNELGVTTITLSGGEPLAHPDFYAIGARAKALGFVVRIKSNGHALHQTQLQRIKRDIDPFMIELSLHGATATTHDRQTRVPGSHKRLLQNLGHMKSLGIRAKINVPITTWNIDEGAAMITLLDKMEVPFQFDAQITPRDNGDLSPQELATSLEARQKFDQLMAEYFANKPSTEEDHYPRGSSDKYCGTGSSTLSIDPFGEVFPCVQYRRTVGNLHQRPLTRIWNDSAELEAIREENRAYKRRQLDESAKPLPKGFCPGIAALGMQSVKLEELTKHTRRTKQR